ncbi:MAG: protein kinase, partial [Solirubrobacteraceae bacterium]|nr:protein kinase [Solirubrobacteraceae bacterium]
MVVTLDAHSYRLDAPLAGSAYGLVWRAARIGGLTGERHVALKFVNQAQMAQAAAGQRQRWVEGAIDEAAFLRQLAPWDARHIVRLLDSGVHEGLPALALELMAGDLGAWMARRRAAGQPGEVARAFDWVGQINQALAKVHQYGRRHLDLKPSNLLLSDDGGIVKLADFGTSRALFDGAPHAYAGTPNWQAPEQVFADRCDDGGAAYRTSAATDYFALGALLYYLVSGGVALRFCRDAAQAWREGQLGAADRLRSRHRGAIPPTLTEEEAALFTQHCGEAGMGVTACRHALRLLRDLLAADPHARPPHA